jgi:hypothetical protein
MAHLAKHVDMVAKALGEGLQQSLHRDVTRPEGGNDLHLHRPRHRLVRTPRRHHRTPDADKGSAYKSHAFRDLLTARTSATSEPGPTCPRTNGKAEPLHPDVAARMAYAAQCPSSTDRTDAMPRWIDTFNTKRPHSALDASFTSSASSTALLL